ncbi:MAG: hypothetical protein EAZ85_08135 [Bacteroidetes bacterium]|nr:MAG: hypothetical protein EAZ85_08135 [Bacteroidota bacterium]TAG87353.1 MAG: hypothetical protein EAZ20_10780 [Bacteroidota bacterium]
MKIPLKVGLKAKIDDKNYIITHKNTYTGFIQTRYYAGKGEDGELIVKNAGNQGQFDIWTLYDEKENTTLELWNIYNEFYIYAVVDTDFVYTYLNKQVETSQKVLNYQTSAEVMLHVIDLHQYYSSVAIGSGDLLPMGNQEENEQVGRHIRFCDLTFLDVKYRFLTKELDNENITCVYGKKKKVEDILEYFDSSEEVLSMKQNLSRLKKGRIANLIVLVLVIFAWLFDSILDKKTIYTHSFEVNDLKDSTTHTTPDFYLPSGSYLLETNISLNKKDDPLNTIYEVEADGYVELFVYEDAPPIYQFEINGWMSSGIDDGKYYQSSSSGNSEYIYMPKSDTLFVDISLEPSASHHLLQGAYVTMNIKQAGLIWSNYFFMFFVFSCMVIVIEIVIYSYRKE